VIDQFLPSHRVDAVVLCGALNKWDAIELGKTIERIRPMAKKIYVVGPIPSYDQPLPDLLFRGIRARDPDFASRHLAATSDQFRLQDATLAAAALAHGADGYFSMYDLLCPASKCMQYVGPGVPMQFDLSHLTRDGSIFVGGGMRSEQFLK
jgi:hypothetical protein